MLRSVIRRLAGITIQLHPGLGAGPSTLVEPAPEPEPPRRTLADMARDPRAPGIIEQAISRLQAQDYMYQAVALAFLEASLLPIHYNPVQAAVRITQLGIPSAAVQLFADTLAGSIEADDPERLVQGMLAIEELWHTHRDPYDEANTLAPDPCAPCD